MINMELIVDEVIEFGVGIVHFKTPPELKSAIEKTAIEYLEKLNKENPMKLQLDQTQNYYQSYQLDFTIIDCKIDVIMMIPKVKSITKKGV